MERALGLPGELRAATGRGLADPFLSPATGEQCVNTSDGSDDRKYCFNPQTGDLQRLSDKAWNVTDEYSDYEPFGKKSFPHQILVVRDAGKVFIEIHIDTLEPVDELDLRTFLPVKGSKEHHLASHCEGIERPKLEKMVKPQFPKQAEAAGLTGVVRLYAEIGTDGIPRGMWPINTSVPLLRDAAIEAVRQWRYRPQICKATGAKMSVIAPITVLFVSH
ncbi:MAG: energy transducer TonB [Acidobacteriota bacterium]|nr:energy transducer TonB [Acidobacteriota bacterium]